MKNNSYEVNYFFSLLCFYSFESWFDITSITETAEDIIAKEREQNILHMLHQVSIYPSFCIFHGIVVTLTISVMKCVKISFVMLNSGLSFLLWHFWTSLDLCGVFLKLYNT